MFTERDSERLRIARNKQSWPVDRPFKILALDGGGIRGIFSSAVVEALEGYISAKSDIADHFDLIAGTSTGGIIAIALGLRLDPKRISALYVDKGKTIFPRSRYRIFRFPRHFLGSLHDHTALETALREEFKSRPLGDSDARLVIPAFVGPNAQVAVFKTDHHPDYRRDWQTPAWEVARATSAAPTFFEGHRFNREFFLDGGVWANNPIMLGIVEALSCYDLSIDQLRVLSIGTGNPQPRLRQSMVRAGLFGWRDIISTAMYLTTDTALSQARLLLGHDRVVRIEPSADAAKIELDDWLQARNKMPSEAERSLSKVTSDISAFFQDRVDPRERHYSRR